MFLTSDDNYAHTFRRKILDNFNNTNIFFQNHVPCQLTSANLLVLDEFSAFRALQQKNNVIS